MQNEDTSLQSSPQLAISERTKVAVALAGKQIISLYKKSEQSGIPFDTLKEVYERGYSVDLTEQTAYNRVNSFIAGGAAQQMDKDLVEKQHGLWDNIMAKRKRISSGSGEHMRKPGSKGAPTPAALKAAQEETVTEAKMRRSSWDRMASALKKSTGKDLNAASQQASQAHNELKQLHKDYQSIVDKDKSQKEEYTGAEKISNKSINPSSRFVGTTALTDTYKKATPGQSTLSVIKKVVRESLGNHSND